jgi:hypothetical protein
MHAVMTCSHEKTRSVLLGYLMAAAWTFCRRSSRL